MSEELLDAARDSMGVYPQSTKRGDAWVKRTEWQEGWNAAIFRLLERAAILRSWYAQLSSDQASALIELLREETMFLRFDDDAVSCFLIMNDVFGYAVADAEPVAFDDLARVAGVWREFGWDGLIAWAAVQAERTPIKERLTDRYHAALGSFS